MSEGYCKHLQELEDKIESLHQDCSDCNDTERSLLKAEIDRLRGNWEALKRDLQGWADTDEPDSESQAAIHYLLTHTIPAIEAKR